MIGLKEGDSGFEVRRLQSLLKIDVDGIFGPLTKKAVIRFQLYNNIEPNGVVGNETLTMLHTKELVTEAIDETSDLSEQYEETNYQQLIHKYFLPKDQYVNTKVKNNYIVLHHTAGTNNPYHTIDYWAKDSRGKIATEFVIGGQNYATGEDKYDGTIVQAFPHGYLAWHIGRSGSGAMNKSSVGIELCSMGRLTDNKTYTGKVVHGSQIEQLPEMFKGVLKFHRYSDAQIEALKDLLMYISERDDIDLRIGLQQWIKKYGPTKAFSYQEDAYYGKTKGLLSHGNIRRDKDDVYPDPRLVDMILTL